MRRKALTPARLTACLAAGTRAALSQWQAARGEEPTGYLNAEAAKSLLVLGAERKPEAEERVEPDVSEQERQAEAEAERARQRQQREAGAEAERLRQSQQRQAEAERQRRERQPGARLRDCEACPQLVVVPSGVVHDGFAGFRVGPFQQ